MITVYHVMMITTHLPAHGSLMISYPNTKLLSENVDATFPQNSAMLVSKPTNNKRCLQWSLDYPNSLGPGCVQIIKSSDNQSPFIYILSLTLIEHTPNIKEESTLTVWKAKSSVNQWLDDRKITVLVLAAHCQMISFLYAMRSL